MASFRKFNIGDKLRPTAAQVNAWTEAAISNRQNKNRKTASLEGKMKSASRVMVSNETGGNLPAFSVLEITSSAIDPDVNEDEYLNCLALTGDTVSEDGTDKIGITQQYLTDGEIDPNTVLSGVSYARLTGDTGQDYAKPIDGETALQASSSGPCVILFDPGPAYEERTAIVRVGTGSSADGLEVRFRVLSVNSGVTPRTALVEVLSADSDVSRLPEENQYSQITVYDKTGCNLVTPYDDLLCKQGYARYMYDRGRREKVWELVSLVCPGDKATACNVEVYPHGLDGERAFYDSMADDDDIGILLVHSRIIGGSGPDFTSGCLWGDPTYPDGSDTDNQFHEFLKRGKSIIVSGEQLTRPEDSFGQNGECFGQDDCDAMNAFFASIGGQATISPANIAPPVPNPDGVVCLTGGIVADPEHRFFVDENGDQNCFFFQVRGGGKINANGSTEFIYVWDSGTGTDTSNCLMAGNQYDAPNAGWVFLCGDADMVRSGFCFEADMTTMFDNICRNQTCLNVIS